MYKKEKSFLKIWFGIAIPILIFAAAAGILVLGEILTAIICLEQLRATQNAMQAADLFGTYEVSEWEEECSKWLQLDRFGIVAAVYDEEGNEIMHSDVESYQYKDYGVSNTFFKEIHKQMLAEIEQAAENDILAEDTLSMDPFHYYCRYDRTMITVSGDVYWLYYGAVSAPWMKERDNFVAAIFFIFLIVLLFTFLPAGYYYMLYRGRLETERYYRHTAAALAHDLKTPLTAISGYAQNLQENVHTEKRSYYTEAILKNVDHMSETIEEMLELARLQNIKVKLHKETINMYELTNEILESVQGMSEEKELMVDVKGNMEITADKVLMKRALGNLIQNAINYTPVGEYIYISMENGEYQITNTGISLTKEEIKKIRTPFVKGEESRGNKAGSGIGLTIIEEIMKLHKFKWQITSDRNPGREEVKIRIKMATS